MLQLRALFGDLLDRALDVLDRAAAITCYRPASGVQRQLLEVAGSTAGTVYKLLPDTNYCGCSAFKYQVLLGGRLTCKHVLACKLARLLGRWRYETVPIAQFGVLCEQIGRQLPA